MKSFEDKFKVVNGLIKQTSGGVIDEEKDVELDVTVGYRSKDDYGWFEFYDVKTGGNKWYAEGGLWFNNQKLTDYDGVFSLSSFIISYLKGKGFDVSEVE